MFFGESCPTDSYRIFYSCLVEHDRIHLSLDDIYFSGLGDRLFGEMESIEDATFIEYG
jgi:hypothetical protein